MTRGVRDAVLSPAYFAEPAASAHADAVFARFYFEAFDDWAAGRVDEVAGAWRLAFGAAERGRPNAATDLLLGMNAYISRDLAYVVVGIAAWQREVDLAHGDFERINDVIAGVKGPMLQGSAARFDPTLVLLDLPLPALAAGDSVDLIGRWRDQALEHGIRLSEASRRRPGAVAVEGEIEREALAIAVVLLDLGTTLPGPFAAPPVMPTAGLSGPDGQEVVDVLHARPPSRTSPRLAPPWRRSCSSALTAASASWSAGWITRLRTSPMLATWLWSWSASTKRWPASAPPLISKAGTEP